MIFSHITKKISSILLITILALAIYGIFMNQKNEHSTMMAPCSFMMESGQFCDMSLIAHISFYRMLFSAITFSSTAFLLQIVLTLLVLYILTYQIYRLELIFHSNLKKRHKLKENYPFQHSYLLQSFSEGILKTRV